MKHTQEIFFCSAEELVTEPLRYCEGATCSASDLCVCCSLLSCFIKSLI